MDISFVLNGQTIRGDVRPRLTLADFLRDSAGLTGTHLGCEHGACGSCTVIVDGVAVRSCLLLAVQAHRTEILTRGRLAPGAHLSPLQAAFNTDTPPHCR